MDNFSYSIYIFHCAYNNLYSLTDQHLKNIIKWDLYIERKGKRERETDKDSNTDRHTDRDIGVDRETERQVYFQ